VSDKQWISFLRVTRRRSQFPAEDVWATFSLPKYSAPGGFQKVFFGSAPMLKGAFIIYFYPPSVK